MFKKSKLKNQIKKCIAEITLLEAKRSRSQSAIVRAILEPKDPDEQDVEFFNKYTSQIDEIRNHMYELQKEVDILDAK